MSSVANDGGCDEATFRAAYEGSPEPFELLRPVLRDGRAVDFVWEYANPAAAADARPPTCRRCSATGCSPDPT